MTHGGVTVDLDEEAGWWQADDFSGYAFWALVIYVRVAAERTGQTVADIARALAARHRERLSLDRRRDNGACLLEQLTPRRRHVQHHFIVH